MKSAHAWVACSLVSASFVFVACGSDDGTKKVVAPEGGTGGVAGEPAVPAGGQSTTPIIPVTGGGEGGTPPAVVTPGPAGAGGGGGGEGGQPVAPLCFDLVDQSAAGAGGVSAGGAAGAPAVPPAQPAFRFRCDDLTLGYVLDAQQNTVGFKLGLKQGAGLLPATGGHFNYNYTWYDGEIDESVCLPDPAPIVAEDGILQLPTDATHTIDQVRVLALSIDDACGNEISLDTTSDVAGNCQIPRIYTSDGTWFIECYEGYGTECDTSCVVP